MDCISPSRHAEFDDVDSMLDFVELLADETGLPVGIKSAVGDLAFWHELADHDGSDRPRASTSSPSTAARAAPAPSPLIFTDTVSLPFQLGFARVYAAFAERGLHDDVPSSAPASSASPTTRSSPSRSAPTWSTSPARRCSPSAASRRRSATPASAPPASPRRTRGSPTGSTPPTSRTRVANYVKTLRRDLLKVAETCGVEHPALIGPDSVEVLDTLSEGRLLDEIYGYEPGWGYPSARTATRSGAIMAATDEDEAETEGPPETAGDRSAQGQAAGGKG